MTNYTPIEKEIEKMVTSGRGYDRDNTARTPENLKNTEVGLQLSLYNMEISDEKFDLCQVFQIDYDIEQIVSKFKNANISIDVITDANGFNKAYSSPHNICDAIKLNSMKLQNEVSRIYSRALNKYLLSYLPELSEEKPVTNIRNYDYIQKKIEDLVTLGRGYDRKNTTKTPEDLLNTEIGVQIALANMETSDGNFDIYQVLQFNYDMKRIYDTLIEANIPISSITDSDYFDRIFTSLYPIKEENKEFIWRNIHVNSNVDYLENAIKKGNFTPNDNSNRSNLFLDCILFDEKISFDYKNKC